MKSCLILEGGGMRGVYTAGVLDFFMEKGIVFDGCIGVSAGALHATRYLSNQPRKAIDTVFKYLNDKEYCSIQSLIKTGNLFGVDLLYNKIPNVIDPLDNDYFKKSKVEFRVVMTNCITGSPEYPVIKDFYEDMKYIQASSSLPLISKLVKINDNSYLDGGMSDSIPIRKAIDLGYKKNIVILTQPKNYIKKRSSAIKIIRRFYRNYPGIIHDMEIRHDMYNDTLKFINEEESLGNIFVIRPSISLGIDRTEKNKEKLKKGYEMGYNDACKYYNDLLEYMKKSN